LWSASGRGRGAGWAPRSLPAPRGAVLRAKLSAHGEADAGEQHGDADDEGEQGTFSAKYKVYSALVSAVSVTHVAGAFLCGERSGPFAAGTPVLPSAVGYRSICA
jgi:hypothetical protein